MDHALYSPEQVAERLGLHVRTVRNYVRDGRLRAVRIGKQYRIAGKDLAELTGQPAPASEATAPLGRPHAEVTSVVELDAIPVEMATRITNTLMAAANGRGQQEAPSRAQTLYHPERMHMKIILVGSMEDNAAYFALIRGVLES